MAAVARIERRLPDPRAFYAISKLTAEYLGLSYSEQFGVDFAVVRFGGVDYHGAVFTHTWTLHVS